MKFIHDKADRKLNINGYSISEIESYITHSFLKGGEMSCLDFAAALNYTS